MPDDVQQVNNDLEAFEEAAPAAEKKPVADAYDFDEDSLPDDEPVNDPLANYYDGEEDAEGEQPEVKKEIVGSEKPTQTEESESPSGGDEIDESVLEAAELRGLSKDDVLKLKELGLLEKMFPADKAPSTEAAADEESGDEQEGWDELDEQDYDPKIVAITQKAKKEITALKAQVAEMQEIVLSHRREEQTRTIDGLFNKHAEVLGEVLGKGTYNDLKPDSPEFKARVEVLQKVDVLAAGYAAKNQPVPPLDKLFEQAINLLHGDKIAARERRQIKDQLKRRAPQFAGVENRRSTATSELDGEAKALRRIQEFVASRKT